MMSKTNTVLVILASCISTPSFASKILSNAKKFMLDNIDEGVASTLSTTASERIINGIETKTSRSSSGNYVRHDAVITLMEEMSLSAAEASPRIEGILGNLIDNGEEESSLSKKKSGINFDRTFQHVEPSIFGFGLFFEDESCNESDEFGDHNCHFNWGNVISGSFEGELKEDLTAADKFIVDMKLNKYVKFKFSCNVCGKDCNIEVPVIKKSMTYSAPACPINKNLSQDLSIQLPSSGLGGVHLNAQGTIRLVGANGNDLIRVHTNIDVD
eukprot:CAMPEP_0194352942 /NCGR_PEP_ID=MMETSP0174-20130528/1334_1 /TAXON_ID=216777 /ORGANISM="Proboscia alata, Strain PI-D3" /LENGTH=270 /DNA_ID=CAMNT_0039121273 /DNA_START=62 /DNA_END=874 /DNA_ORIENTATION=+